MPTKTTLFALLAVSLVACKGEEAAPPVEAQVSLPEVLPNLPLPPGGQMLAREGTGSALQIIMSTVSPADSVVAYYREVLALPPYRLINEATTNGMTAFFVEQDGPSMWVAVQGLEAGGTLVTIAGAKPRVLPGDSVRVLQTRPLEPGEVPGTPLN